MVDWRQRPLAARRLKTAAFMGASVAAWFVVFAIRLGRAPRSMWFARDDAVITLSHARNAALFGTIGVSPGDRVEGFSSPLHFAVAYIIERVSAVGWGPLTMVILIASLIVIGASTQLLLRRFQLQLGATDPQRAQWAALGLSAAVAFATVVPWRSAGWIGSGMENPLIVATAVMVVTLAVVGRPTRSNAILLGLALASLALSRVELAGLVASVVPIAAWVLAHRTVKPNERVQSFVITSVTAFGLIASVHVARRLYFGSWLPNTALVQNRVTSGHGQMVQLALFASSGVATFAAAALHLSRPARASHRLWGWVLRLAVIVVVAIAARNALTTPNWTAGKFNDLLRLWPVSAPLVALAVLWQARRVLGLRTQLASYLIGVVAAVPLAQYVILGPSRLDPFRIAIVSVPFLAIWVALSLIELWSIRSDVRAPAAVVVSGRRQIVVSATAITAIVAVASAPATYLTDRTVDLKYEIAGSARLLKFVDQFRDDHLADGGLVLLANPDLGKVSFDKSTVVTDIGFLGDPVTTGLRDSPELLSLFLSEVARPDVLEGHGWLCPIATWTGSTDFGTSYELIFQGPQRDPEADTCFYRARYEVWQRVDADAEIALTNELLVSDDPVAVVTKAVASCAAADGGVFRCEPVRRSVQRALPTLQRNRTLPAVAAAFAAAPTYEFDRLFLMRPPGWGPRAVDAFKELSAEA